MAYSNRDEDKLYHLLPAYIREQDAVSGEALKTLLAIVEAEADRVEASIAQLGANAFIETCEPWVVPYIGDLVGATPLFDESRVADGDTAEELFPELEGPRLKPAIALRTRADVAKTIYYRRRKGTAPMLEELARDVTGWSAHVVEFFELLGWTQWLRNHQRPQAVRTPDIRSVEAMDRLDRAFDHIAHTVDVRPVGRMEGWHNIRNVGFFLWRLGAYPVETSDARRLGAAGDFRYFFSPLGQSAPLFSRRRPEGDETGLATELHVPQAVRPALFFEDLRAYRALPAPRPGFSELYGPFDASPPTPAAPHPSFSVVVDATPAPADRIVCRDLSTWSAPATDFVAIDVARGRLTLGPALLPAQRVQVSCHYGFPAELGGGPYGRRAWLTRRALAREVYLVDGSGAPGVHATIGAALGAWTAAGKPNAIIRIRDNRSYAEAISIEPADDRFLAIEAADGFRPHLMLAGPLTVTGDHPGASVTLGGLLVEGVVEVAGDLRRLRLIHTTLVPGASIFDDAPPAADPPSISVAETSASGDPANVEFRLEIAFSIVGPVRVPEHAEGLFVLDSVVDGVGTDAIAAPGAPGRAGPPLHVERSTLRGTSRIREIAFATETIFDGTARTERVQRGCVRFSYVPRGSRAPRQYRCQPALAIAKAIEEEEAALGPRTDPQRAAIATRVARRVKPEYASEAYGQPAYLQLSLGGPKEIALGAEDGSEMGVYCCLKQPQREANLRARLDEYLPFGLEAGLIYVT
ncbi:hypothetical protein [Hansschlegelia zhihuaiae]|uniref:Uncharacterized protein n=1 Tax=Hansschlegelia zhihuaiae TaxID=405005 RepID=A0A4Q0MM23_9HYPH|nr:hypothetical protein [Hansschlegelia zhihuaiae]RXF74119.1 hypothetical protein EK403_07035 [Hansschlegelia zhihuaiae]